MLRNSKQTAFRMTRSNLKQGSFLGRNIRKKNYDDETLILRHYFTAEKFIYRKATSGITNIKANFELKTGSCENLILLNKTSLHFSLLRTLIFFGTIQFRTGINKMYKN